MILILQNYLILFGKGQVAWNDTVAMVLLYKTKLKQSDGTHTLVTGRTKSGGKKMFRVSP